ncbi:uncharacterized protein LOC143369033 [Andrena cerasifolii]|uniref:uncharacterized protein LOC143369033 n=1 Tax=Andrena cerasifolii TaxID=2819439 RepID=UPI00403769FD
MKATLALAFATILVAFASTSQAVECPQENGALVTILPNPEDCKTFYICNSGTAFLMQCSEGLEFNARKSVCDFPEHAMCHAHHRPSTVPPTAAAPSVSPTAPEWETSTEAA